MSLTSITSAQRAALATALQVAGQRTQDFNETYVALQADKSAVVTPYLVTAAQNLTTAGISGLPDTSVAVANGDTVAVRNSAAADSHNATAVVAGSALTGVNLAATVALVDNADAITMQNSAGTAIAGTHAATVAAGVLSNVKLAATIAPVANAQALAIQNSAGTAVAGTHAATVAAGVVSNIKLAATVAPLISGTAYTIPVTNAADIPIGSGVSHTLTFTITAGVPSAVTIS